MKTALIFLACLVVVKGQLWNPLGICDMAAQNCPDKDRYCCRSNTVFLGLPVCELRPHLQWPCDPTLQTSCECVPNTACVNGICQLIGTVPEGSGTVEGV